MRYFVKPFEGEDALIEVEMLNCEECAMWDGNQAKDRYTRWCKEHAQYTDAADYCSWAVKYCEGS